MARKRKLKKEELIDAEIKRLNEIYSDMDGKQNRVAQGLILRAAFMRVSLDEMEKDINENGYTEQFSQGNQEPYDRKRPVLELYNTMNANYQKICKQLSDILPKIEVPVTDDGFDDFVNGRDEL
nr:MAG TPA: hypothetical protein [Caudoviricetes sp.]